MRPARLSRIALVLALCAAYTACSARTAGDGGSDASGHPTATGSRPAGDGRSPSANAKPGESRPASAETTTPPDQSGPVTYADDAGVGQMARAYLRGSPARRLVVEVDYVSGRTPSADTLDHLAEILRRECRKSGGVTVTLDDEIPAGDDSYSYEDIARLERRHRDRRSGGDTATMYLLYLNGELSDNEGALGVAYKASAAAIFADRARGAATGLVQPGAIERSVVTHEAGHLLALVNIGYRNGHDQEDPDHRHHSRYRTSVMYWAVEDVSVSSILTGGPPDDFDRYDRDDLGFLRGDA